MSRKLTLNIGLRYELWSPIGERFGRQANFDLQTMTLYIPKGKQQDLALPPNFAAAFPNVNVSRGEVGNYLVPWDKLDFGPRIGIAYQANQQDRDPRRLWNLLWRRGEPGRQSEPR